MNKKRAKCETFSIIFLIFSACFNLFTVIEFLYFVSLPPASGEGAGFINGITLIAAIIYLSLTIGVGSICGFIGAIFSCFNLHCEIERTRKLARNLLIANGVLTLAFSLFFLIIQFL